MYSPETFKKNIKHNGNSKKNDSSESDQCSVCKTRVLAPEKDIVLRMKSVFHKTLLDIGM